MFEICYDLISDRFQPCGSDPRSLYKPIIAMAKPDKKWMAAIIGNCNVRRS